MPDNNNSDKTINLQPLSDLVRGDKARRNKFIDIYLRNVPDAIEGLKVDLKEKDYNALYKHIHSFKPQVKMMGLMRLEGNIDTLEKDLKEQVNLVDVEQRISFTIGVIEESVVLLKEIVNQTD
jgi:hypothetical protein